ncbi:unnamed protein product, partial [Timema podura]|nr:unnamed protein product [Timema podura]
DVPTKPPLKLLADYGLVHLACVGQYRKNLNGVSPHNRAAAVGDKLQNHLTNNIDTRRNSLKRQTRRMVVVETQGVCKDREVQRNVRIPQCITNDLALGDGKGMGSEGLIRFLRAKVKVLQDEVSKLQADYKK